MFYADTEGVSALAGLYGSQPGVTNTSCQADCAASQGRRMTNYTILLIDYEPRSIERFRQPLTSAGYTVEIATDGIAGIEAFTRLNPDMVLVEAMIPKKHGFEVCQELKRTPHGRRTPIIITTGVYKGRKYRTQALHIYGCDEYIEKPIAPEQLLAVVGKFFGGAPAAAGGSPSTGERSAEAVDVTIEPGPGTSAPGSGPSHGHEPKASGSGSPQMKTTGKPTSVVSGLTEEEIMARLDAILPGGEGMFQSAAQPATTTAAAIETIDLTETEADVDPFRRMRDELNSELGALSAALAVDPAPVLDPVEATPSIPSDQSAAPSLLESLPVPEIETPEPASAAVAPSEDGSRPAGQGQVVHFDAKRSKKSKKGKKGAHAKAAEATASAPAQKTTAIQAPAPIVPSVQQASSRRLPDVAEFVVPTGSVVATELGAPAKRGVPAWLWIGVVIVALAGGYVLLGRREAASGSEPVPRTDSPRPARATQAAPPAETPAPPAPEVNESAPAVEPPHADATPPSHPVKTAPTPKIAVAPPKSEIPAPAPAPAPTKSSPAPAHTVAEFKVPAASTPRTAPTLAPAKSQVTAPSGLDAGTTAGVESVAGAAELSEKPKVAPGTMMPIDQVDTLPVTLSRTLPIYSVQARQMRIQGTVVLNVLINDRGTVDDVVVAQGVPGGDVNEAAVKAAKQWTYRPATKDGVAVKVWKSEFVTFKL